MFFDILQWRFSKLWKHFQITINPEHLHINYKGFTFPRNPYVIVYFFVIVIFFYVFSLVFSPVSCHWSFSISLKNSRKPLRCFMGNKKETSHMKWVNCIRFTQFKLCPFSHFYRDRNRKLKHRPISNNCSSLLQCSSGFCCSRSWRKRD